MTELKSDTHSRSWLYGALAVLIAGATAGGAWRVVHGYQLALDAARHPAQSVEVLTAIHELGAGQVITADDVDLSLVPRAEAPADQVFTDRTVIVGETVVERILPGEVIRRERITLGGNTPRPDLLLEPGTRAVTVKVDRAAGVGGLVSPGTYVDVIVTIRPDANALGANWVTETIIQAVRVLAVGDTTVANGNEPQAKATTLTGRDRAAAPRSRDVFATLEVEPDEAEKLAMATSRGDLYLSLRPRDDFDITFNESPLVTNELVGISAAPSPTRAIRLEKLKVATAKPAAEPPSGPNTEVISGSQRTTETFDAATGRLVVPTKGK